MGAGVEDGDGPVGGGAPIVHIVSGVLCVGGAALFFLYIEPTINKLGPDAEKFVDEMINRRKVPIYFMFFSTLTVIAGLVLYFRDAGGLQLWTSATGITFTIGGLAAIVAWLGGNLLIPRTIAQLGAIGAEIKTAGGPPSSDLQERLRSTQERLHLIGLVDLILLLIAVVAMAIARYLR